MSGVYSAQLLAFIFFITAFFFTRLENSKWVLMPQGVLQCLTLAEAKSVLPPIPTKSITENCTSESNKLNLSSVLKMKYVL